MTDGLIIKDLRVGYGRNEVIHSVDMHVDAGERVALLGANGAGKSTILKTVSGLLTPKSGSISWQGDSVTSKNPSQIVEAGVVQVPEGRRVFPALDVDENLRAACIGRGASFRQKGLAAAYEAFPDLAERKKQPAGLLSGGQQQMLVLGRAIVAQPALLMIDEMSLGLAPLLVNQFYTELEKLFSADITVFLVEQNAGLALENCSRFYVLRNGEIALTGDAADYRDDPTALQAAYLGLAD